MSKNQMIPNKVITFPIRLLKHTFFSDRVYSTRRIAQDKKLVIVQSKKARQII